MLNVNQMRKSLLKAALEGNWELVRLGDIISLRSGHDLPKDYDTDETNGTPYITGASNFHDGEIIINRWTSKPESIAHKGDILLTCKGTVGKVAILELEKAHIARQVMAITPLHDDIKYIAYVMKNNAHNLRQRAKSFIPGIERKDVLNMLIPLPPLSEQALIVSKLDALFDCLDKLDSAQKKFEHDKEIFRKSILKAAFEEAGTLGEWVKLGDVGEYKKGPFGSSLTKSIFVSDSSEAVKVYEQKNAIRKNHKIGKYFITRQYYEGKMKGFTVKPGDIIVSCAGTIGETYLLPEEAREGIINQALMRIRLNDNVNKAYFLYCFEAVVMAKAKGKGSAIKNIPPFAIFKNILIPLPPLEEQRRIVKRLDELMSVIDSLKE